MKSLIDIRLLTTILVYLGLLFWLPVTFKIAVPAFLLLVVIIKMQINNLFIAAFLVSILTFQLFTPNKYYSVPTIQDHNFRTGIKVDYLQSYGLNLDNIFILLSILALVKHKPTKFRNRYVITTAVIGIFCIIISVANSFIVSSYSVLSVTAALQYGRLFIVALLSYYLLTHFSEGKKYLTTIVLCTLLFQSSLALIQFIRQSPVGSVFENAQGAYFSTGSDENNALYRVEGTFAYHNQFAIIIVILFTLMVGYASPSTMNFYLPLWIISGIIITLTQSRSSSIAFIITSIWFVKKHRKNLGEIFRQIGYKKIFIYITLVMIVLSPIIIPRIILSTNIFSENGAIETRRDMIQESLEVAASQPLFGFGPRTNENVLFDNNPDGIMSMFTASVHNGLFSLLLEVGVVGLVLYIMPFFILIRLHINRKLTSTYIQSPSAVIFILGSIAWVVYYIFQPHNGLIEFPYVGLVLGYGLSSSASTDTKKI